MNRLLIFIICVFPLNLFGQMEVFEGLGFGGNSYDVVIIKATPNNLKKFEFLENTQKQEHTDAIRSLASDFSYFAINAGSVESDCSPVGLLVDNYTLVKDLNLNDGQGNFYLKPNGVLLFTDNDVQIIESSKSNVSTSTRMAIQSGPMLVIDGSVHASFNVNSLNKNYRAGVGIFTDSKGSKFLVFAVSRDPVTFYTFSQLFLEKYNCQNALCLESAGVAMSIPYALPPDPITDFTICRYITFLD